MAYSVSVAQTYNQDTDGLLSGAMWNSLNLTYSFPTQASYYGAGYGNGEPQNNFKALNADQMIAVRKALGMVSAVTNISFSEMQETSSRHATLRVAGSDEPSSAWSYTPADYAEAGDVWLSSANGWYDKPRLGEYGFYAVLHEIGHTVGLKHGNETEGFGAMTAQHDAMDYSVMTYRSYVGASGTYLENETWGYAQSLMMYDIAALQHMYGADFTTNGGNTVYRWDPATGQAFVDGKGQGAPGANRIFATLWDGGGNDTYDLSGYASNLSLDLRPGAWSTFSAAQVAQLGAGHAAHGNIANALLYHGDTRSLIENAIGGSGGDTIIGNAAANTLRGNGGSDRLTGLEGRDVLIGGAGNDVLTAGAGADVFVFDAALGKSRNLDRIADFNVADDRIDLAHAVFSAAGKSGALGSSAFWIGAKAHDSSDRIIYDAATGALYYDSDGNGGASQIQFAQAAKALKMSAGDFMLV